MLVGNKKDLTQERQVSEEEGRVLADKFRVPFVETSAKTNENVSEAFFLLVRQINKFRDAHPTKKKKTSKGPCTIL